MDPYKFNRDFQKFNQNLDRSFSFFKVVWALAALLGLVCTGVMIWAVVRLVMHFAP